MRWTCALLLLLASFALGAGQAGATSVTVVISGTWTSVDDSAGVMDGSASTGDSFTATLTYDDAAPDLDGTPEFGAYFTPLASGDFTIVTGNYSFSPGSDIGVGVENDNLFGEDWIFLYAEDYVGSGPFPGGVGTGATAYANPSLVDYSGTAHSSDALVGLNWNLADYDGASFYLFVEITGAGPLEYVEFFGTITDIQVLPEPSASAIAGVALLGLILARRRG
jgi:hypothetical protein